MIVRAFRAGLAGTLVLVVCGVIGSAGAVTRDGLDAERQGVIATFGKAQSLLAAGNGAGALALLSRPTLARVETIHTTALSSDKRKVAALGPSERFAAVGLRHFLTSTQLRRMSVPDLANHALSNGWLGPNIIAQSSLGNVTVNGDRAVATVLVKNKPTLVPAEFVRENGAWRIDLVKTLTLSDGLLRTFATLNGQTEDGAIASLLERLSGRPVALR